MKLAEALILRADAKQRFVFLQERLKRSARVQEGDTPPEDPQALLDELASVVAEFTRLIKRINHTNSVTALGDGRTLTDALADRDGLTYHQNALRGLLNEAAAPAARFAQSNIRIFRAVDVAAVQKRAEDLARQRRELDAQIQALNWSTDLIE